MALATRKSLYALIKKKERVSAQITGQFAKAGKGLNPTELARLSKEHNMALERMRRVDESAMRLIERRFPHLPLENRRLIAVSTYQGFAAGKPFQKALEEAVAAHSRARYPQFLREARKRR